MTLMTSCMCWTVWVATGGFSGVTYVRYYLYNIINIKTDIKNTCQIMYIHICTHHTHLSGFLKWGTPSHPLAIGNRQSSQCSQVSEMEKISGGASHTEKVTLPNRSSAGVGRALSCWKWAGHRWKW